MTYGEAKNNIWREHCCEQCDEKSCESCTYNKAILALEKQIPTKPLPDVNFGFKGICPNCRVRFIDDTTKYCGNCGQALDWSVSE